MFGGLCQFDCKRFCRRGVGRSFYRNSSGSSNNGPYLGQVVGQLMMSQSRILAASGTQMMCRKMVYSREALTSVKLRFGNWYVDNTTLAETGTGNDITVTCGIEYPLAGTPKQVTWGGSASVVIPELTTCAESDAIAVTIPANTKFAIRTYVTCTVAMPVQSRTGCSDQTFNAGSFRFATSGLTDQTMVGGATSGGTLSTNFQYQPLVFAQTTINPSVAIIGDSKQEGNAGSESYANTSGDIGETARCIGPSLPYTNFGKGNDAANRFLNNGYTLRLALKDYFSHVACNYGHNDINTLGRTPAQVYADLVAIRALYAPLKFYQLTIGPNASSSDSWATIVNQSADADNADRITLNNLIKGGGFDGNFDICTVLENTPNSDGKWIVTGAANYATADGVHESTAANELLRTSGIIPVSTFVR